MKPCGNLRKPVETRRGFLYCWNCTETFYIRFHLTETLRKLFNLFPHCWNCSETYTSGFHWRKLNGIQLKLYNSFRIAKTIQETSTLSSIQFQQCFSFAETVFLIQCDPLDICNGYSIYMYVLSCSLLYHWYIGWFYGSCPSNLFLDELGFPADMLQNHRWWKLVFSICICKIYR